MRCGIREDSQLPPARLCEREEPTNVAAVQNRITAKATLASDADTELHIGQTGGVMGISADRDHHAVGSCVSEGTPVEIELMRIRVDLDGNAGRRGFQEHLFEVDRVRFARQQQPPSRVAKDREIG